MSYEKYKEFSKKYIKDNHKTIEETKRLAKNSVFPQNILWMKEVTDELSTEFAKSERINNKFYFTEELVNRLMLFAFLKGKEESSLKERERGWDDCLEDVANKLGLSDT